MTDAWAAGFFEGEGSICIVSKGKGRGFALTSEVSQTDRQPLDALRDEYGGHVYSYDGKRKQRPFFRWALNQKDTVRFLDAIEPHVVRDKVRRRIAVAKAFQAARCFDWSNRSVEYKARDAVWIAEMRALNANGLDSLTPLERAVIAGRGR